MKWSLFSTSLFWIANIFILEMYAKGKLGQTPLSMPFILVIFSSFMVVKTAKKIFRSDQNHKKDILKDIACIIIWISLIAFNIYQFNSILYVS